MPKGLRKPAPPPGPPGEDRGWGPASSLGTWHQEETPAPVWAGLQRRKPQPLYTLGCKGGVTPRVPQAPRRVRRPPFSTHDPRCSRFRENAFYSLGVLLSRGQPGAWGGLWTWAVQNVAEHRPLVWGQGHPRWSFGSSSGSESALWPWLG